MGRGAENCLPNKDSLSFVSSNLHLVIFTSAQYFSTDFIYKGQNKCYTALESRQPDFSG